jgi:cytochrome P450
MSQLDATTPPAATSPRLRYPPGPRSAIPFKVAAQFRGDVLGNLTRLARQYGDSVWFRSAWRDIYLFYHPDAIRDVLVTHDSRFIKGPALRQAKDMLGEGLLTSEGEFHKRQRRLAQPAFHPQRVATYADVMVQFAERMGRTWRTGQICDIHEQMMQLTLEVVSKTLFDADVASEVAAIGAAMDVTVRMFTRAMIPFGWLLNFVPFLPSNIRFLRAKHMVDQTIAGFIRQRRAAGVDRGDLLSMLLRATDAEGDGSGMSDRHLRDECITLFSAGHETTANALTFTWYLLAQHPEVEATLREELRSVLGGRPPTNADVPRLPYTRAVLAESMRLYPPAWAIGREVMADNVEIAGYRLKPKAVVLISQWVTHRDERFWPDPQRFDPRRWLDHKSDTRPRYAYFPFGGGSRGCIGESFAWMEATLIIATLAQRWRMDLLDPPPVHLQPTITLRPRRGIRVRLLQSEGVTR